MRSSYNGRRIVSRSLEGNRDPVIAARRLGEGPLRWRRLAGRCLRGASMPATRRASVTFGGSAASLAAINLVVVMTQLSA